MTGALIAISIVFIVWGAIAAITLSYHRLQRHRADAVAPGRLPPPRRGGCHGADRRPAQLASFDLRLAAIEKLLKDVQ